jgi:hypothetical protein
VPVEEDSFDDVYPLMVEANLHSHGGMTPEAAEANAAVRRMLVDATGTRFFVARVEDVLAGLCELSVHGGVAEIDNGTRSSVSAVTASPGQSSGNAVREAREAGAGLVFLIADDADWPKELYAKLGFDPVGRFWQFTKPSAGESYR